MSRILPSILLRQFRRHFQRRAVLVDIFGVVAVEAVAFGRHDLAGAGDEQAALGIFQHAAFDLAAPDEFFGQQLAVVLEALGERRLVLFLARNLADADGGALPRRLDEDRQAEFALQFRKGGVPRRDGS